MSTRSGKRIHSSFHENTLKADEDTVQKSEVKTRSKKQKENDIEIEVAASKTKKRANYVTYPGKDEDNGDTAEQLSVDVKKSRKSRKNALKDHNIIETEGIQENKDVVENVKAVRLTRRTRHFHENAQDETGNTEIVENPVMKNEGKAKKKKSNNNDKVVNGKSKKKKGSKGKKNKADVNKSSTSLDSFYSAAGSPIKDVQIEHSSKKKKSKSSNSTFETVNDVSRNLNETFEKKTNKRKSLDTESKSKENSVLELQINDKKVEPECLNTTFDKVDNRRSSLRKSTKSESDALNSTYDKKTDTSLDNKVNGKSKKSNLSLNNSKLNGKLSSTFEKARKSKSDIESYNTSNNKKNEINTDNKTDDKHNSTFEKKKKNDSKTISLNSTYDKESNSKLDVTFDKSDNSDSNKSDNTLNVTFNKSNSPISITSDESKAENIVNTTPVLIESSMDESIAEKNVSPIKAITPLKREGTFTKESPTKFDTPSKRVTLHAPGSTPYHGQPKDKRVLNVTRSIEKPRRSSLADLAPRQTKVMFCSPVNTPMLGTAQKKTVIKSSMKGSNKSFVFDDSASVRPSARKRSLTHDEGASAAKRKRGPEPAANPGRARTLSAVVKPVTPKPITPGETRRTKLPDFAALHQRRFAKMESLDECQQRKAQRAKRLLTPSKLSRGKSIDAPKPKENPKPAKKSLNEPPKPKLPTLDTLQPGYTRFGFKMNIGINPFGSPSKRAIKPKENKPNGIVREPSQLGTTRKEAAKQAVMREKSFSMAEKRQEKRKENRTVIKGVRTNRRFELQMQMRNIN